MRFVHATVLLVLIPVSVAGAQTLSGSGSGPECVRSRFAFGEASELSRLCGPDVVPTPGPADFIPDCEPAPGGSAASRVESAGKRRADRLYRLHEAVGDVASFCAGYGARAATP